MNKFLILFLSLFFSIASALFAEVVEVDLAIDYKTVNISGKTRKAISVNNQIPAPSLRMKEGDVFRARVHNKMDVETSIHWHGLLLPNFQDGVPYITTPPIDPGTTFTYEFPIRQAGTYWYHSHTGLQEQLGVYGAIVIEPQNEMTQVDKEYVLVLSDWTDENPHDVLRTLKSGDHYYLFKKKAMPNLWEAFQKKSLKDVFLMSLVMMPPMDISDVGYDSFLINGSRKIELDAKPGDRVRLRIINSAASTYFYLEFAGGNMTVVAADGLDVAPTDQKRVLIAIAETYDVIITVPDEGSFEFRASAQDGSGSAAAFIGSGDRVEAPNIPKPNLYKMEIESGERPLPPYKHLRSPNDTTLPTEQPWRDVHLTLTGDMERYLWSFNGKTLRESDRILVRQGENVRFIFENKTMMHHPLHLHGHFFRVVNEQGQKSPLKHTVDIPPFGKQVIEFDTNEYGDWFFHCHILYHMMSGMTRVVHYEGFQRDPRVKGVDPHEKDHYYFWAEAAFLTQMTEGSLNLSGDRNSFHTDWEAEWDGDEDESYEVDVYYQRYFNRFLKIFAGVNPGEEETRGMTGLHTPLPLNLEGEFRIDTEGVFRFMAEKHLQLLSNLTLIGHGELNSDGSSEGAIGLQTRVSKNLFILGQAHSEFGSGAGIKFRF